MTQENRIQVPVSLRPELKNIIEDIQRRELRGSRSAMIELLIYEALVARGEIVPIQ